MTFQFTSGWEYKPDAIAASVERMEQDGHVVQFAAAVPSLAGNWKRLQSRGVTGVFAQDSEMKLLGHWRPNNTQARGTCVGQGTSRGAEDSHIATIARGEMVGQYALLCFEPMYAWCRINSGWGGTHQWGCQCGRCPDGLSGSDAAEFLSKHGAIRRGVYGQYDLSKPREDLAINWNNSGVPQDLITAGETHKYNSHRCMSIEDLADAVSAEYYGAICLPVIFDGSARDGEFCLPSDNGGHCTEVCGVFLDSRGETAFMIQQSWPEAATNYPHKLTQWQGPPKDLRPACYPIHGSTLARYLSQWESWVFGVRSGSTFR